MREMILFDQDWLFHKGDIFREEPKVKGPIYTSAKTERMKWGPAAIAYQDSPDSYDRTKEPPCEHWFRVNLPHDYVIGGELYESENPALGFFKYENAWYRKHFTVPAEDEGKRITLLFEAVATRCTVYLNGCELKHNTCGYNSFEVDLTDYLFYGGENVLAVYVAYHKNEGWWYQGGGIYRHVWLKKTESIAADLWGVFIRAEKRADDWRVLVDTEVRNDRYEDGKVTVTNRLQDAAGTEVLTLSGDLSVALREKAVLKNEGSIKEPHLWDVDDPYQYTLVTEISENGVLLDRVEDRFGFRDYQFTAEQGLILNGRRVFINGVCGHGDFGLTGKAVPDNIFRYKVRLMKEMGANGYRTSHYPQAAAMMDALDANGFIVMAETRWFDSADEGMEQLAMLVKRDRNRPSVFMWSMGNEEPHHLTAVGKRITRAMSALTRKLDPTRPITSAVSNDPAKATVYDEMDLVGVNYNHYLYDIIRAQYPDKPIYASECCATGTTRGWYEEDEPSRARASAFDHTTTSWFIGRETFMKVVKEHPWLCGMYQWIAFEHRGEAVWPRVCSISGAIDLFLQKKDAFYQNQSIFLKTPMIHLLPHWNILREPGEIVNVWAYTTCEEAELFLNGRSLGRKQAVPYEHLEWAVPFEPGKLEVIGYENGQEACRDGKETSGRPVKLCLKCENADDIRANGEDIAMFTCWCEDAAGRFVPDAAPTVTFHSNLLGTVVGTGSDNTDHIPVTSPTRTMYAGLISAAVRLNEKEGELIVWAESGDLTPARIKVPVKK